MEIIAMLIIIGSIFSILFSLYKIAIYLLPFVLGIALFMWINANTWTIIGYVAMFMIFIHVMSKKQEDHG